MLNSETMKRLYIAYDRGGPLINNEEFVSDASRIVLVSRLIGKWVETKDTNLRLIINHIVIIENVFGDVGLYALYEYIGNYKECVYSMLTVLYYMNKVPKPVFVDYELLDSLYAMEISR